jgi:hypothetical protein
MSVCSGVAFQPAHYIVSLKNLTASSIFDFKGVNLSLAVSLGSAHGPLM